MPCTQDTVSPLPRLKRAADRNARRLNFSTREILNEICLVCAKVLNLIPATDKEAMLPHTPAPAWTGDLYESTNFNGLHTVGYPDQMK